VCMFSQRYIDIEMLSESTQDVLQLYVRQDLSKSGVANPGPLWLCVCVRACACLRVRVCWEAQASTHA